MAEYSDEDIFASEVEEDFSPDLFEDLFYEHAQQIKSESVPASTKIGFAPTEEISTLPLMFNIRPYHKRPMILRKHRTVDSLMRHILLGSDSEVSSLPGLHYNLQLFLRNDNRMDYGQLSAHCVMKRSSNNDGFALFALRGEVESFAVRAAKAVIPCALLGGRRNWNVLMTAIRTLLANSSGCPLLLGEIMRCLAVRKVHWFPADSTNATRSGIMALVMKWLLRFFMMLIAEQFYVTYTMEDSANLYFIHKPAWMKLISDMLSQLCQQMQLFPLDSVDKKDFDRSRQLLDCHMRLVPKKSGGARPIMSICYGDAQKQQHLLVKGVLQQLVRLEVTNTVGTNNHSDIEALLLRARARFPGKLEFVTVDIKDAYGSVQHFTMSKILHGLGKKWFLGKSLTCMHLEKVLARGRKRTRVELVSSDGSLPLWSKWSQGWKVIQRYDIDNDKVRQLLATAVQSYAGLRIHYGSSQFYLTGGLPQGGKLSPFLCDLYYGAMDQEYLSKFAREGILVRAVDDYLFVTNNCLLANEFKQFMEAGLSNFSCHVNLKKTQITAAPWSAPSVSFCGVVIYGGMSGCMMDITRYTNKNMAFKTAIPLSASKKRNILWARAVGHPLHMSSLLLNVKLNGQLGVLRNVQVHCLLVTSKFIALLRRLFNGQCNANETWNWAIHTAKKSAKKSSKLGSVSYDAALCVSANAIAWRLRCERDSFGSVVCRLLGFRKKVTQRLTRIDLLLVQDARVAILDVFEAFRSSSSTLRFTRLEPVM